MVKAAVPSPVQIRTQGKLGESGTVYEFNVKIYNIDGNVPEVTDEDWEYERELDRMALQEWLTERYSWIGDVYFSGRSGGWLAIEDCKGLANEIKLKVIASKIAKVRLSFKRRMENTYGSDPSPDSKLGQGKGVS